MAVDSFSNRDVFLIKVPEVAWEKDELVVKVHFECEEYCFEESFEYSFPPFVRQYEEKEVQRAAEFVALAAVPSYYKAMLAKNIQCDFDLTIEQVAFLQGLLGDGLAEFRFKNDIELTSSPSLRSLNKVEFEEMSGTLNGQTAIVPIGGGKDSATSLEIVKRSGLDIVGFSVGSFPAIESCAKAASIELVHVNRQIDPKLFELNKSGFPNGHVPVTALTSALAILCATVMNAEKVIMSNESSADESTRVVDGYEVNHQWSKSSEAEKLIREAVASSGVRVDYFSALRELSEFEIFSLFSNFEKFHGSITSCNNAFKIDEKLRSDRWCCDCDKCRFVFLGLSAYLGPKKVAAIFGKNLFDDSGQLQGFKDLLGISDSKPFECVGTTMESRMLLRNCLKFDDFNESVLGPALEETLDGLNELEEKLTNPISSNFIEASISDAIRDLQVEQYSVRLAEYLSEMKIGVVGLGRDTSSIIRFLSKYAGVSSFDISLPSNGAVSDSQFEIILEDNALTKYKDQLQLRQEAEILDCDIVFVSPGISKYSDIVVALDSKATTPLAWWLEYNKAHFPNKCFIGVTGTKGKSTTASLLNHVLPNSIVAGNLGFAVGNISVRELIECDFVILEVSSFQASYVKKSPDIVAITSLFDCHIDWHRTPFKYRHDKLNLALHGASELIVSDTIADFAPLLSEIRNVQGSNSRTDVITLVPSVGRSLLQRNQEVVRAVVGLVSPLISSKELDELLDSFAELKHRQEIISTKNGVVYVSDVLTTVDDFILRYPNANIFLLLGGADREVDQSELIHGLNLRREKVRCICLPETGLMVESELKNSQRAEDLMTGVNFAADLAEPGDIVLLAPGAPSFHRYKNYEDLADHFSRIVDAL